MIACAHPFSPASGARRLLVPSHQGRSWLLPLAGGVHLVLALALVLRRPRRPAAAGSAPTPSDSWCCWSPASSSSAVPCMPWAICTTASTGATGSWSPACWSSSSAMTLATLARHLGLLWLAVETTTLASAPLIYYNRNQLSIEATWKYLLICSVGIALAMLGILFVAYAALHGGAPVSLQLDDLLAGPGPFPGPGCRPASSFCWSASAPRWAWRPCTPGNPTPTARRPGWSGRFWPGG